MLIVKNGKGQGLQIRSFLIVIFFVAMASLIVNSVSSMGGGRSGHNRWYATPTDTEDKNM